MTTDTMSEGAAASLRAAVNAARAASNAAAHTAALILIEADGGGGQIHRGWRGEGDPDAWCVVTSARFTAHMLTDSFGDRAQVSMVGIAPDAYVQMRAWAQDLNECRHEHNCECLASPWPTLDRLAANAGEHPISYRGAHERGDERGSACMTSERIIVTLFDEPVTVADTLLRINHAVR